MNFESVLDDIEKLINFPLSAINPSTPDIKILSINFETRKYVVKSEDSNRKLVRSFSELELIFDNLNKKGICNVPQVLLSSSSSSSQPETIFANLPYIQFFSFERQNYLVLRDSNKHALGVTQKLPLREQNKARKALSASKKYSQNLLAKDLDQALTSLNDEINSLHIKQPGFLVDTQIREILAELKEINATVQSATISLDEDIDDKEEDLITIIRSDSVDMSDLVDLSSYTGVDDGNDSSQEINNGDEPETVSELIVPNIRRQTPSLYALYQRLAYEEIEIQPDYQRKDRIWTEDKKSKLIESILMGLPLPIFYFGERKNDNWVVIDGLQRLTTVQDFMMGKFALNLDKESSVYDANGKRFTEFDRKFTRAINEFEITAYVIDMEEDPYNNKSVNQFIVELFHRINTYGVKLSDQEIRSAINFGNSVFYLKFLASSQTFISATNNTVNPKRQKDLELCLSALSFMIFGYECFEATKFDNFLSAAMSWINDQSFDKTTNENGEVDYKSSSPDIIHLTSLFESSLKFCKEIFGVNAFKKTINPKKKEPISKPFFEVLVTLFANTNEMQRDLIREHKSSFIEKLYSAIKSDSQDYSEWISAAYRDSDRGLSYALSTSTGKKVTIYYRFEAISKILQETTGCKVEIKPLARLDNK